ncbi:hypothetical protein CHARACLAT_011095 [Characodon lateralis]|uniref:Uncharacterized protein n=1 Tax=Characodon lateralis TaxID=208331 RepID=A0ABU7E0C9_9TELE|nr:hypothetical protein [Characodon lateralis]
MTLLDHAGWQPPDSCVPRTSICEPCPPSSLHCTSWITNSPGLPYPPTSVSPANNHLVSQTPPLADPSTILFCILVPVPCIIHPVVNKHFTEQYCLLNCFLHVGQIL